MPPRRARIALALLTSTVLASLWIGEVAAAPWCGTAPSATDVVPDVVTGAQVHVIYATPSDGADRFATWAPLLVDAASAVSGWWRREDSTRALRYDLAPIPGCAVAFGNLDLSSIRLPDPSSAYAPHSGRFTRIRNAVLDAGFARPTKKYLVYYDGPLEAGNVCGTASGTGPVSTFVGVAVVYLACINPTRPLFISVISAHEILHALGALPVGAPNACPGDLGHPCDSGTDILRPTAFPSERIEDFVLDFGRNDYYAHAGAWWDVQDSPFLRRLLLPELPISLAVSGSGTVTSDLPGVLCVASCTTSWEQGTAVRLSAAAAAGFRFAGWSGACSGEDVCALTVGGPLSVTAAFVRQVRMRFTVRGDGLVSDDAGRIQCRDACDLTLDEDTELRLEAEPDPGYRLSSWTGACAGTGACTVRAADGAEVGATFALGRFALRVAVGGRGVVTSTPAGIACPARCTRALAGLTSVRLRARPSAGWRFVRWQGACRGRGACVVRMTAERSVRAVFARRA